MINTKVTIVYIIQLQSQILLYSIYILKYYNVIRMKWRMILGYNVVVHWVSELTIRIWMLKEIWEILFDHITM